jgi:DNA ligase-1
MLLAQLVTASEAVAATRARRQKVAALAACIAQLAPEELAIGVAFLAGEPRNGRIGIGYSALRALPSAASEAPSLTLLELDATLARIAEAKGEGSAHDRAQLLHALFARATAPEQDFLQRLLVGELRQGALEGVMLDALAQAFAVPADAVRRALMLTGELGIVAEAAQARGAEGLAELSLQLFRPLSPMLAQTARDAREALAKLGEAAFEHKLDGARVQVHKRGEQVRVFTRHLNEVTDAVPELVEAALALPAQTFVLDGEAIALRADGRPQPFQVTMRRFGRRLDVSALRQDLPLSVSFFDALHIEGRDLLDEPASARADALAQLLPSALRVPRLVTRDVDEANAFIEGALAAGHEGAVAKALDGRYEAGRRGGGWLKIKRAHTLDLIVLAAEWGSGRRKGFLSNLHLGARAQDGSFVMLGKTFKGMTDDMLAFQTRALLELEVQRDAYTVYVRPELMVEVAFDGVQASPHYPGGVALRFARIKGYRLDKPPSEADTIETVQALKASDQ